MATAFILPITSFNCCAILGKTPTYCNELTLNKIPKKNKILGVSIFRNA